VETSTKKRNELYGKAQSIIAEDAPIIAVANPAFMIAFRDRIQGFTMRGVMSYEKRFYDWRIKE
jgi:ABC-type transport system substrate-binding protein